MYVFDLDGTLSLNEHRKHHLLKEPKNWDAFNADCIHDLPHVPIIRLAHLLAQNHTIAILSGRGEIVKKETVEWLRKFKVPFQYLDMRKTGDYRDDCIIKLEMMETLKAQYPMKHVHAVFDDRQKVVDMWRANGYACLQVAPGAF